MRILAVATIAALAVALAGCGSETPGAPAAPPKAPAASAGVPDPTASTPLATSAATPPAVRLITVPNVVGKNHQAAQNTMQAAGLYNLREVDATGQGRLLIWDRNWEVVRQSPSGGRRVKPDAVITLFSKKIGE
jgi:hypothetical protein